MHRTNNGPSLPVELWCAVFACLPLADRIAITHVCRAWRNIALDAPAELWAQIYWSDDEDHISVLDARLQRAGSVLVDLSIALERGQHNEAVVQLIRQNMPRLRVLQLDECHDGDDRAYLRDLLTTTSAPQLEWFCLRSSMKITGPLFNNDAPKLRHVELEDVDFELMPDAWHNSVETVSFSSSNIRLPDHVIRLLAAFPSCDVLKLNGENYEPGNTSEQSLSRRLYGLMLRCGTWQALSAETLDLFDHVAIPAIDYIVEPHRRNSIDARQPFPYAAEIPLFGGLAVPTLHMSISTYQDGESTIVEFGFEDMLHRRRIFSAPHASIRLDLPEEVFTWITSLDIDEHDLATLFLSRIPDEELGVWYQLGGVFPMLGLPYLRKLSLFLLDRDDYYDWRPDSPFLMSRAETSDAIEFERLSELRLSSTDGMLLAPEMISELVAHLGCLTPLGTIVLHNVHVLENRVDAVAEMLALAKIFEISPEPLERMSSLERVDMLVVDDEIDFF